jgi:hypothetical protein
MNRDVFSKLKPLFINLIPAAHMSYTAPETPKSQPELASVRGVNINKADFDNYARPVIYGEVTNRPDKKDLESRVILNTAINRISAYKTKGKDRSLADVLSQPNQYQAYNGPQYNLYKSGGGNSLDKRKKEEVDRTLNDIWNEMKKGDFTDNTAGAYYYQHEGDKIYYDNKRPLFGQ